MQNLRTRAQRGSDRCKLLRRNIIGRGCFLLILLNISIVPGCTQSVRPSSSISSRCSSGRYNDEQGRAASGHSCRIITPPPPAAVRNAIDGGARRKHCPDAPHQVDTRYVASLFETMGTDCIVTACMVPGLALDFSKLGRTFSDVCHLRIKNMVGRAATAPG